MPGDVHEAVLEATASGNRGERALYEVISSLYNFKLAMTL
jgi:hypothetical protein